MRKIYKEKICSIICSYHPDIEKLYSLSKVLSELSNVVLVDNSRELDKSFFEELDGLVVYIPECNLGTLKANNIVIEKNSDYKYFWLWDQDTAISIEEAKNFLDISFEVFSKDDNLVVTTFFDKKNWKNPLKRDQILIKESTSLFDIKRLRNLSIGLFDESLFMDYGDWDLSYRIQKAGGGVYQISGINYTHSFGNSEKTIIGNFNRSSEIRLYMQGMNYSYLIKNRCFFSFINFLLTIRVIILPFKNLLFNNSTKRTRRYFSGIIDGLKGKTSSDFIKCIEANL